MSSPADCCRPPRSVKRGRRKTKIAAIKEALAKNQAALRQYSWIETTQISLKGEVKKTEQKQCFYGAEGKVHEDADAGRRAAASRRRRQAAAGAAAG